MRSRESALTLLQLIGSVPLRAALCLLAATLVPSLFAYVPGEQAAEDSPAIASFVDVAAEAGLTMRNVFGGQEKKSYIIETTGTGVAIFDYDNDGWPDIFLVNGPPWKVSPPGKAPPIVSIATIATAPSPM